MRSAAPQKSPAQHESVSEVQASDESMTRLALWWHGDRFNRFNGNQWQKPLSQDELKWLYNCLRELSFFFDFSMEYFIWLKSRFQRGESLKETVLATLLARTGVSYRATEEPRLQVMRPLANWLTCVRCIFSCYVIF